MNTNILKEALFMIQNLLENVEDFQEDKKQLVNDIKYYDILYKKIHGKLNPPTTT
jgi:hypothetical protein